MTKFAKLMEKLGADKVLHFLAGMVIMSLFSGCSFECNLLGAFIALIAGAAKEQFFDDEIDQEEIIATAMGGVVAAILFSVRLAICGF